jgi:hypothetical protein
MRASGMLTLDDTHGDVTQTIDVTVHDITRHNGINALRRAGHDDVTGF